MPVNQDDCILEEIIEHLDLLPRPLHCRVF
jgi:hypothetical protein